MRDRAREPMNDTDFDALLARGVPELPPEKIVEEVTPWKKSIHRVLIGMALTAITLNFCCLNYILPAIGTVLLLLGFRTLRRENRWFRCCFVVTVARAAYLFPSLILNSTILSSRFDASAIGTVLTAANLLLLFIQFVGLWRGFRAVQVKAGLPPHAGGAVALIVWYALMCLLALVQYSGLLIAGGMIAAYCFILRSLYQLSKELDAAGYAIQAASVQLADRWVVTAITVLLLIGIVCGYTFGGSYPMDWAPLDAAEHREVEEIKAHLRSLGFPEYVLNDLSAEDIAACEGALQVVVDVTDEPVNDGRVVTTEYRSGDGRRIVQDTVYDLRELRITGVGVQLPGERERWMIFHHFLWTTNPGFYGTESIQLWPVYRGIAEGWCAAGDITGRVLYDRDGASFAADYYALGSQTYTASSIWGGSQSSTDVFATFSMPRNGQNHRGYIAYPIAEAQDGYIISSWINYTHQRSWMQYPAVTAMQQRMTNGWHNAGPFKTIQDALQFYPTEEAVDFIN